jgi:hypothetical protein
MKQINAFIYMLLLSLNIFHYNHNLLFQNTRDCELINFFPFSHHYFIHFGLCKTDFSVSSSSSQQMLKVTSLCTQAHLTAASNGVPDINKKPGLASNVFCSYPNMAKIFAVLNFSGINISSIQTFKKIYGGEIWRACRPGHWTPCPIHLPG